MRSVQEKCAGGEYRRRVQEESAGGVCRRSVQEECAGGVCRRRVQKSFVVWIEVPQKNPSFEKIIEKKVFWCLDQWVFFLWCIEFNWLLVFLPKSMAKCTYTS